MYKKLVLVILLLLTGCQNRKMVACEYNDSNSEIYIDITAINDDISSFNVKTCYEMPNYVMINEKAYSDLLKQLDSTYHFEGNTLIKEDNYPIDGKYSLALTKDRLRKMRFYCE